jgi:hypothetical protein
MLRASRLVTASAIVSAPSAATPAAVSLNAKVSLFLTRPGLPALASALGEYRQRTEAVFSAVADGTIKPAAWKIFALPMRQRLMPRWRMVNRLERFC